MNPKNLLILVLLPLISEAFTPNKAIPAVNTSEIDSIYSALGSGNASLPDREIFRKAMAGLSSIRDKEQLSSEIVSIIDFTKPSTEKRFWVIDLKTNRVLHHTLVAHGKNSGELYASKFSNTMESLQSSTGFFKTGTTYIGKHGLSLKLHGLEPGVNDKAEARAIVIHGADYVSEQFVKRTGRLGRSFGCPAIPYDNHKEIIKTLANGSCLYIHYASA